MADADPRIDAQLLTLLGAGLQSLDDVPAASTTRPLPHALDDVLALADRSRLGTLAALGAVRLGAAPERVHLEERKQKARREAALFSAMAAEVRRRLDGAGVVHLFFKGTVVDPLYYGGRGLRGTSDVDVLVEDLERAQAALAPLTTGEPIEVRRPRLVTLRKSRTVPTRIFGAPMLVDLQAAWLMAPPFVDDTAAILSRRQAPGTLGLAHPQAEDYAAYIGGNLVQDRFSGRLKLALDLARLFKQPDVRWDVVVERARRWRVSGALWALADLVERALGVQAPALLRAPLAPPAWRRALLTASADGAGIPGAFTRALEGDSLFAGARHFARYLPARVLDRLLDE